MGEGYIQDEQGGLVDAAGEFIFRWLASFSVNQAVVNVSLAAIWPLVMMLAVAFVNTQGSGFEPRVIQAAGDFTVGMVFIHLGLALHLERGGLAIISMIGERWTQGRVQYRSPHPSNLLVALGILILGAVFGLFYGSVAVVG